MSTDEPKLRMAPRETAEDLARRVEREHRASLRRQEDDLHQSLAPYRVGSVPYLNAVPLTRGIEDQIELLPPAQLADKLRRGELDAALVSVTEVLFHDAYDVLDGVAIASLGEVRSVLLAHRRPLEQLEEVWCDPASLTSVNLLRVLLAERGIRPVFRKLEDYGGAAAREAVLLIGDEAIRFQRAGHGHEIWDLGAAWYELTGLPFVYAVWAIRRGIEAAPLCRRLREARSFGLDTLDAIIRDRTEFDLDFRKDYLGWHIHYHLGTDEKRGLHRFMELLRKHGSEAVYEPRYIA